METPFSLHESKERSLFRRMTDGTATPEEFRDFEKRLLTDAQLRSRFIMSMGLEAGLYEEISEGTLGDGRRVALASSDRQRQSAWWPLRVVAICLSTLIVAAYWLQSPDQKAEPQLAEAGIEDSPVSGGEQLPAMEQTGLFIAETEQPQTQIVAIVTYASPNPASDQADWFKPGQRFGPGLLTVPDGEVQLEFLNGAQVLLQGPAKLRIHDVKRVTLESGRAAAQVPPSAIGFVMNAPDAAVVDLGTAFTMNVEEDGQSNIFVTEGEVEVSLLGQDGNTLRSERLTESKSVRVVRESAALESLPESKTLPLTIPTRPAPILSVTPEYVATIKAAEPFAYWRFQELHDNRVPNEMGEDYPAVLHAQGVESGITVENGVSVYGLSNSPRHFSVEEGLTNWNTDSFSIELWVCPRSLHHGTVIDVLNEDWSGDLNSIEIALKTSMIHPPGAFRFLHRHPPGMSMDLGINLFDRETCTPGQWSHLVAVKTPRSLSLYINGQEIRRYEGTIGSDDERHQLIIGAMEKHTITRQFQGALDEIALYRRALTPEEISNHHRLLNDPMPDQGNRNLEIRK